MKVLVSEKSDFSVLQSNPPVNRGFKSAAVTFKNKVGFTQAIYAWNLYPACNYRNPVQARQFSHIEQSLKRQEAQVACIFNTSRGVECL
jgi:hypothetical protein